MASKENYVTYVWLTLRTSKVPAILGYLFKYELKYEEMIVFNSKNKFLNYYYNLGIEDSRTVTKTFNIEIRPKIKRIKVKSRPFSYFADEFLSYFRLSYIMKDLYMYVHIFAT